MLYRIDSYDVKCVLMEFAIPNLSPIYLKPLSRQKKYILNLFVCVMNSQKLVMKAFLYTENIITWL